MKDFKKYINSFIHNEEGFELLQVAIVVLIVAVLAGVIAMITANVQKKLEEAASQIDDISVTTAGN